MGVKLFKPGKVITHGDGSGAKPPVPGTSPNHRDPSYQQQTHIQAGYQPTGQPAARSQPGDHTLHIYPKDGHTIREQNGVQYKSVKPGNYDS